VHFRIRKNIVQLVRTTYDSEKRRPKAQVVGRIPLVNPLISDELKALLTPDEYREAQVWIARQHRTMMLREEFAAMTLTETLAQARRWFQRQSDTDFAGGVATEILPELKAFRKSINRVLD